MQFETCFINAHNLKFTLVHSLILVLIGFEGQNYRKVEDTICGHRTKMKSKNLYEAKADCYRNPDCYMMYDKQQKGTDFYSCSGKNAHLMSDNNSRRWKHATYVKGKGNNFFLKYQKKLRINFLNH